MNGLIRTVVLLSSTTSDEPVGLDPTAQVLLTIFGAAIVTALAGFAGAWLQGRRDHARWLRERRLVAYTEWLAIAHEMLAIRIEVEHAKEAVSQMQPLFDAAHAAISVAPPEVPTEADQKAWSDVSANMKAAIERLAAARPRIATVSASLIERGTGFELLGPGEVHSTITAFSSALNSSSEEMDTQLDVTLGAMRRTLKIDF